MSSGYGNRTPNGRCYPVFMVRYCKRIEAAAASSANTDAGRPPVAISLCADAASALLLPVTRAQEFKECVATEGDFSKCLDLREDYMECLHHKKEARAAAGSERRAPLSLSAQFFRARRLSGVCCATSSPQVSRFNALNAERERKVKAGDYVPPLVSEQVWLFAAVTPTRLGGRSKAHPRSSALPSRAQIKKGDVSVPWTYS